MLKNQVLPGAQIQINGLGYTDNIGTLEACVELCKNTAGCAAVGRKTAANRYCTLLYFHLLPDYLTAPPHSNAHSIPPSPDEGSTIGFEILRLSEPP